MGGGGRVGPWVVGWVLTAGLLAWGQSGPSKPSAAVAEPGARPVPGAAVGRGAGTGAREPSVEAFLREFERASELNDANVKAALYGEVVDRYFLRTHVTREFVYRDVLDWLSRGRLITRFRLTVLGEDGEGDQRTLLVRKDAEWLEGGAKREFMGRSQLVLRRVGGAWRIVGERDYKPS